jgi:hypothetical protein
MKPDLVPHGQIIPLSCLILLAYPIIKNDLDFKKNELTRSQKGRSMVRNSSNLDRI